ncbi:MAG: hypothetical protein JW862_00510, partial [Anaerolineales bacterium]|nr:hypothetical protein [Anaerolineales bacterium]
AIIGQVPQNRLNRWYVYEYFEGTYAHDLARFPTWGQVLEWAITAGFRQVNWQAVEWIHDPKIGPAVFQDPFLRKEAVSQLALLSQREYEAGLAHMAAALAAAEQRGQELEFVCDLRLDMLLAKK